MGHKGFLDLYMADINLQMERADNVGVVHPVIIIKSMMSCEERL